MPLHDIKNDHLMHLTLKDKGLHSEDLFILSQYLKHNHSITHINLSKNNIGFKYVEENKVIEIKMKNQDKLKDFSFQQLFYDSLGLEHFCLALCKTDRLVHLDISENDLGPKNFNLLHKVFRKNTKIECLNIADCMIDGKETKILCESLMNNKALKYLFLRNCNIGDEGSTSIASLIDFNKTMIELEIFNCGITE